MPATSGLVFAGFSQGVAMAYRAAAFASGHEWNAAFSARVGEWLRAGAKLSPHEE